MRIGIDIDDTILDTMDYLNPFISKSFNISDEIMKKENIFYINLPKRFHQFENEFLRKIFEKELLNIPVKKNAKEIIDRLKRDNHEIIFITARNNIIFKDPYLSTIQQLDKLNIKYDKIIFSKNKREVCLNEKIDIFIDDSIDNISSLKKEKIVTILFESSYNKNIDCGYEKMNSWNQIYEYINNL